MRRSFRVDGGAETSVGCYLSAIQSLKMDLTLVCESWDGPIDHDVHCIKTYGSRLARAKQFRAKTQALMASRERWIFQSHDWIPGAQVIRLGDGLHSVWFELLKRSRSGFQAQLLGISGFHRDRIRAERETFANARLQKVIVNSEFVSRQVIARYPEVADKVVLIRNVVRSELDPGKPKVTGKNLVLGFAGSGWERKGLSKVIQLLSELPAARLIVVGRDKSQKHFQRLADFHGVSERILWLGVVSDMSAFYQSIDILVHPALYDPAPNVAMEAMAFGIPVVGADQTGIADFTACDGVFVVPEGKLEPMVSAVENAALLPISSRRLLQDAVRPYSRSYLVSKLRETYEGIQ